MRRRNFLTTSLGALAAGLATPRASAASPVPYGRQQLLRLPENRPGIPVILNGQGPFRFLIDTATSHTVLTPRLRQLLALPTIGGSAANIVTAAGAVQSFFHPIDEVATAGVIVENARAVVIDLPDAFGVDGILGADFLWNFTVDLDLGAQVVTLYPEGTRVTPPRLERVKGSLNAYAFIMTPIRVNNILAVGALDTGARQTVVNTRLASFARVSGTTVVESPLQNHVLDAAHQRYWAETRDFTRISLGPRTWSGTRTMIADLKVFDQIGIGNDPAIFIGMDLMAGRRIILDYAGASLYLAR